MKHDYCIAGGLPRDLEKALKDEDFFHKRMVEGRKIVLLVQNLISWAMVRLEQDMVQDAYPAPRNCKSLDFYTFLTCFP